MVFLVPSLALAENEYAGFTLRSSKDLLADYKFLQINREYNKKLINKLNKRGKEYSLLSAELKEVNRKYKGLVADLESSVSLLEVRLDDCQDRGDKWKTEYTKTSKKLVKALNKPWYHVDFRSLGYGATIVLILML